MRSVFLLLLVGCVRSVDARYISTWIAPGKGGIGNRDLTESLSWLTQHQTAFKSLSVYGYGPGGAQNLSSNQFNLEVQQLGIDVYTLWGGQWESFKDAAAINNTVQTVLGMVLGGNFTGVDLDFEHPETWGPAFQHMNTTFRALLKHQYSQLLTTLSSALHAAGGKMSSCVGTYPTREGGVSVFYDPQVVGATNDVVRVMNYDMYYVGGRGIPALLNRPDCYGMGPTSTQPWAKASMEWWMANIPKASVDRLVMGLPSYSNDYSALPGYGGANGTQVCSPGGPTEAGVSQVEQIWDYFSQIYQFNYKDANGLPRIRYATEAESTAAHLRTADALGLTQVGLWTWNMADAPMASLLFNWTSRDRAHSRSAV